MPSPFWYNRQWSIQVEAINFLLNFKAYILFVYQSNNYLSPQHIYKTTITNINKTNNYLSPQPTISTKQLPLTSTHNIYKTNNYLSPQPTIYTKQLPLTSTHNIYKTTTSHLNPQAIVWVVMLYDNVYCKLSTLMPSLFWYNRQWSIQVEAINFLLNFKAYILFIYKSNNYLSPQHI